MTALDRLLPAPRLVERDHADIAAPPEAVWARLRHGDLATAPLIRALFVVRTLPERLAGHAAPLELRLDAMRSTPEAPGFRIFVDDPPHELCVGAIGKVWEARIPFVHTDDIDAFARFDAPGEVKVAWALRVLPLGERDSRVEFEVRVDATDDASWSRFRRYFRFIGPGSHFIRRTILSGLEHDLGTPESRENTRPLEGDALLPDAAAQLTHGITIAASPEQVFPWLVQMGGQRAGFYSIDLFDNAFVRSARELHPDLQSLTVGQVIPASPEGTDGFEVLRIDAPNVLVLGGLFDADAGRQLPFASPRPDRYWQITWAFVIERLDEASVRLHVRARAAFAPDERLHAAWIRPVHRLMQRTQLARLAARVEGRAPRDDVHDVLEGASGAAQMAFALLTPFLRASRSHHGLTEAEAARTLPGDALITRPTWQWTHGIEIEASAASVWPWVAQIGADRGGFYSYQWLENIVGCEVHNAEVIHPEWQLAKGDGLSLHPKMPPIPITELVPGSHFVAYAAGDATARVADRGFVETSWLFFVEPLGEARCRVISRFRAGCSDDVATRMAFGPVLLEPIGFVMDRKMLEGIKARAERR